MANNKEVIDGEAYHRDLQRNSSKRKYHKIKEENIALETKLNKVLHANDTLHRQVFEQNHKQRQVAQLLGFDDFKSVEANINANDPWIPGGQSRILLLEEEIAKCGMEAQAVRADMEERLTDAQNEALRLRQGRDFARREAERHAADARVFRDELQACRDELRRCHDELQFSRNEVTAKLSEMQSLIREQQINTTLPGHSSNTEKEVVPDQRGKHGLLPLREIANTLSLSHNDRASRQDADSECQYYKTQYELLEVKYMELLAAKRKVSQKYLGDLKRWKEFKEWIVKDEPQTGHAKRRALRRRKVMEIGLLDGPYASHLEDVSVFAPSGKHVAAADQDMSLRLVSPTNEQQKGAEDRFNKQTVLPTQAANPHPLSSTTLLVTPRPAPLEESLNQMPSIPTTSNDRQPAAPICISSITELSEQPPLSQESLTQASSSPPSPVREPIGSSIARGGTTCLQRQANDVDSSPIRVLVFKQEPETQPLVLDPHGPSENQETDLRNPIHKSQQKTNLNPDKRSEARPLDRKRPCPRLPSSVPLPSTRFKNADAHVAGSGIRQTMTVLAADTPPRANGLVRHHSLPPDSPHVRRTASFSDVVREGKRKLAEMDDTDEDVDPRNNSDPFVAEPSGARPTLSQTRDKRAAHLKALGKQSNKEYMAEYMPYKGRGRYSNAKAASNKNVNAEFEIDPVRNDGVNYQFDAVVRDKAGRKNLEASDCECCRDYYEAIGPLPPRLQPPKWRSPSRSQGSPSRPCRYQNKAGVSDMPPASPAGARATAIESHKYEISRHRHNWAPPTTPPSYWHIGFPDTQEVEDINRQANDMHERKLKRIEAEANSKNGRYRRRE